VESDSLGPGFTKENFNVDRPEMLYHEKTRIIIKSVTFLSKKMLSNLQKSLFSLMDKAGFRSKYVKTILV